MGGTHSSVWFVLLPFSNGEGSFLGLHFLKIAIVWKYTLHLFGAWSSNRPLKDRTGFLPVLHTVRYFCETFIQPVRVSFLHNYRTVLLNSIPYGTSSKPSFSPYGFHFYTTTVRSRAFWMQYSKGVYRTVQYFTFTYKGRGFLALWLDPTPFSLGHACSHVLPQYHHFQPDPPKMSCQLSSVQKFWIPYGC